MESLVNFENNCTPVNDVELGQADCLMYDHYKIENPDAPRQNSVCSASTPQYIKDRYETMSFEKMQ